MLLDHGGEQTKVGSDKTQSEEASQILSISETALALCGKFGALGWGVRSSRISAP